MTLLMLVLKVLWSGEAILSVRGMRFVILMKINLNLMKLQVFRKKKVLLCTSEAS